MMTFPASCPRRSAIARSSTLVVLIRFPLGWMALRAAENSRDASAAPPRKQRWYAHEAHRFPDGSQDAIRNQWIQAPLTTEFTGSSAQASATSCRCIAAAVPELLDGRLGNRPVRCPDVLDRTGRKPMITPSGPHEHG